MTQWNRAREEIIRDEADLVRDCWYTQIREADYRNTRLEALLSAFPAWTWLVGPDIEGR